MKPKQFFLFLFVCCIISIGNAQVYNLNPDPNGEPWWSGGVPHTDSLIRLHINEIPFLEQKSFIDPPAVIDNSKKIFMRPIFTQEHYSCAQASGVGYIFTYEINWLNNTPANNTG